jgi:hypothetical protein
MSSIGLSIADEPGNIFSGLGEGTGLGLLTNYDTEAATQLAQIKSDSFATDQAGTGSNSVSSAKTTDWSNDITNLLDQGLGVFTHVLTAQQQANTAKLTAAQQKLATQASVTNTAQTNSTIKLAIYAAIGIAVLIVVVMLFRK